MNIEPGKDVEVLEERIALIEDGLHAHDEDAVHLVADDLHPAELADVVQSLVSADRSELVDIMGDEFEPELLPELDETVRVEVVEALGTTTVAAALEQLDVDEAVEVLEDLDDPTRFAILEEIDDEEQKAAIFVGLSFPEETAGRLLTGNFRTVASDTTVTECLNSLRDIEPGTDFYELYVLDADNHPIGIVPLCRLVSGPTDVAVTDIMETDLHPIEIDLDQEDVADRFRHYDLVSAPVVDDSGAMVGLITIDDVLDVIDEEAEEDLMLMGGVGESDLFKAGVDTMTSRFSWLSVNLVTAIVASVVISLFADTIEQVVALAVLMPIVASMGGNAGTQAMTVAVRGIATGDLNRSTSRRVVSKETFVGLLNGGAFAVIGALVAFLWFGDAAIAGVIAIAMLLTLLVAGFSGVVIPLVLRRLHIDPAIGSSVVLTTVTDVVGFLTFLGFASLLLVAGVVG